MENTVCKKLCTQCAPDNPTSKCGSVAYLKAHLTSREIRAAAKATTQEFDLSFDETIKSSVCSQCSMYADECNFRGGKTKSPCGGYSVIEHLLKQTH